MDKKCEYCETTNITLLLCGNCKATRYCSKECQVKDFKSHKKICNVDGTRFKDKVQKEIIDHDDITQYLINICHFYCSQKPESEGIIFTFYLDAGNVIMTTSHMDVIDKFEPYDVPSDQYLIIIFDGKYEYAIHTPRDNAAKNYKDSELDRKKSEFKDKGVFFIKKEGSDWFDIKTWTVAKRRPRNYYNYDYFNVK